MLTYPTMVKLFVNEREEDRLDKFAISTLSAEKRQEILHIRKQGFVVEVIYKFHNEKDRKEFLKGLSRFGKAVEVLA